MCKYFEGGVCGNPEIDAGEVSAEFCRNCKGYSDRKIIIFEGPDNSGKTSIIRELSLVLNIPSFKNPLEKTNFKKDYIDSLHYEGNYLIEMLRQTGMSIILDRSVGSEFSYSKTFNRPTDERKIFELDEELADLGAVIIYCYKECYNKFTDELVKETEMKEIRENFDIYLTKTKMKYLRLDTTDESLKSQISKIMNFLENKK